MAPTGQPSATGCSVGSTRSTTPLSPTAERFVLAPGSRPHIPTIPGLGEVDYLTSDTVMRIETLPESMVIVGGRFITAEMDHIFGALGVAVTIVERGPALLRPAPL